MKRIWIALALLAVTLVMCFLTQAFQHRQMGRMLADLDRLEEAYNAGDRAGATKIAEEFNRRYQRITSENTTRETNAFRVAKWVKLLVDSVLQSSAGLECRSLGSRNGDLLACSRVAAYALASLTNFECAEACELNLFAICEGVGDGFDNSGYCCFSVLLGNGSSLCDCCDELCLIHYE